MRITESLRHAASPEAVFEMLSDPAYQERRCVGSGSLAHEVTLEEPVDSSADGPTVITRRRMSTQDFPDMVRRIVGSAVDIVETTRWGAAESDGTREAGFTLSVEHTPVTMVGGVHLAPARSADGAAAGSVTTHRVDGELSAHVPFIGGNIERSIGPVLTRAIELESRLGQEWLAGR